MHTHQRAGRRARPDGQSPATRALALARAYVGGRSPTHRAPCFLRPDHELVRRLVPGYEAPVNLVYSQRNRSAGIRSPCIGVAEGEARGVPLPDAAANPYLAFAAMLMAGWTGSSRARPGTPADTTSSRSRRKFRSAGSLAEALDALEADHEFLTAGGVFSET